MSLRISLAPFPQLWPCVTTWRNSTSLLIPSEPCLHSCPVSPLFESLLWMRLEFIPFPTLSPPLKSYTLSASGGIGCTLFQVGSASYLRWRHCSWMETPSKDRGKHWWSRCSPRSSRTLPYTHLRHQYSLQRPEVSLRPMSTPTLTPKTWNNHPISA